MTNPVKHFLQNNGLEQPLFSTNSRYAGSETAEWKQANGKDVVYVKRRLIPKQENFATLQLHILQENDRLDNLSAQYFSDAQLYWRLCDANGAMNPDAVTKTPGSTLRITLPEGIAEPTDELE